MSGAGGAVAQQQWARARLHGRRGAGARAGAGSSSGLDSKKEETWAILWGMSTLTGETWAQEQVNWECAHEHRYGELPRAICQEEWSGAGHQVPLGEGMLWLLHCGRPALGPQPGAQENQGTPLERTEGSLNEEWPVPGHPSPCLPLSRAPFFPWNEEGLGLKPRGERGLS